MNTKSILGLALWVLTTSCALPYTESLIRSSDGGSGLGYSVDVEGDTAVAGAYMATVNGKVGQGAAYVFERTGTTWTQTAKLTAADGQAGDHFGADVCVSGNFLAVGADLDDDATTGTDTGAVYVFEKVAGVWTQRAKLQAADGAVGDQFGYRLALQGDLLAVTAYGHDTAGLGNAGQVYLYRRNGIAWTESQRLAASDPEAAASFGWTLGLDGPVMAVGAFYRSVSGATQAGAVYVFEDLGSAWSETARLTASDYAAYDHFSSAIAVRGDEIVVGADMNDDPVAGAEAGSAYVFRKSAGVWNQTARLVASDIAAYQQMGLDVDLEGDLMLVGAYLADISGRVDQGAVYVYQRNGSTWTQTSKLTGSDGRAFDHFGWVLSVSNSRAFVGAFLADFPGSTDEGELYVYDNLLVPSSATNWQVLE